MPPQPAAPRPRPARPVDLRAVEPADLDRFFAHQLHPDANVMAAFGARDPADRDAFDERWRRILADPEGMVRTILADGEVAGYVLLWRDPALEAPEVSYWLGPAWWGRGVASEALRQFLALVAERPLLGRTSSTNPASRRVLERAGFHLVRIDRDVEATDGRRVDELVLRLDG